MVSGPTASEPPGRTAMFAPAAKFALDNLVWFILAIILALCSLAIPGFFQTGIFLNIVVGIIGALIGGFLLSFFLDTAGGGWWFTLFTAILGSVILLWLVGMVQRRSKTRL